MAMTSLQRLGISLVALFTLTSCDGLKQGLDKAILIDYDQTNNFKVYQFPHTVQIGNTNSEIGVNGYLESPLNRGFWVTYVLCNLRNEGADAQTFNLDLSKFYVVFEDRKFYYKPIEPYTYATIPSAFSNPQTTDAVNKELFNEIQLGPSTDTFKPGYYPALNYRIAIHVIKNEELHQQNYDPAVMLALRYDGYPNLLKSRNQPLILDPTPTTAFGNVTQQKDLLTSCRPQIVVSPRAHSVGK